MVPSTDTVPSPVKKFRKGDTKETVRSAQGEPEWITKHGGSEMWTYDNSIVLFRHGVVSEYKNISKNLRVVE